MSHMWTQVALNTAGYHYHCSCEYSSLPGISPTSITGDDSEEKHKKTKQENIYFSLFKNILIYVKPQVWGPAIT